MEVLKNLDHDVISKWFKAKLAGRQPFFYNSVDIRESADKIAPVDTNLFPAGFNNLSGEAVKAATEEAKVYLSKYYPEAKKIAILAENFTRNKFYWDNILALKNIIESTGCTALIMVDDKTMPETVESSRGKLAIAKIGAEIDLIIANKDFTSGSSLAASLTNIPITPSPLMGWHTRRKSRHFQQYDLLARDFARDFSFDPWLISTLHQNCGKIDFKKGDGFECLADNANNLLAEIRRKYREYNIESEPYLFIKADSGTFGMGIMTIKSILEIREMNKKLRNKMDRIKEGVQNTEVIIQEGVPTIHQVQGKTAEPFIYCINNKPIGAILRVNENRDEFANLNSAGMTFEAVDCEQISGPCEFSPLGIIARLAGLAAINEAEEMQVAA